MKMKIMVCHDGSENAQKAMEQAVELFKPYKPEIILVSVVEGAADASSENEEIFEKQRSEQHDFLKKTSEWLSKHGCDVDAILAMGDARKMLLETAAQKNPNILVIGKRGRGVIKDMVLGSVSAYLIRHAKCPVLVFHT
jgi:nucleotide-binding universal stress UspA family protein